jgi:hypothetical protein
MSHERLNQAITAFHAVLVSSWGSVHQLATSVPERDIDEFLADWAQATWEMTVEAAVSARSKVYLEPYGEGADCNPVGSRVWHPGVSSTHTIHCRPLKGVRLVDVLASEPTTTDRDSLVFDQFVTLTENGWFEAKPPFDHVLAFQGDREKLFPLGVVDFVLVEIAE